MRVTDSLTRNNLLRNVEGSLSSFNAVEGELATGKRLNALSDDPVSTASLLSLRSSLVDNTQYQKNADSATAFLSASDSALSSANDILRSAKQIAIQGASDTQNADDRASLTSEVNALISELTHVANSDSHGKYLFGGTKTQAEPFVDQTPADGDPTPTYVGDSGSVTATVGKNDSLALSVPGDVAFGGAFQALQTLQKNLTAGNTAAISASITDVDKAITQVSSSRGTIGAGLTEVAGIKDRLTRAAGEYQNAVSNIEDVDLSQAYVKLQSSQNVYQASLAATQRAFQVSLAEYLK